MIHQTSKFLVTGKWLCLHELRCAIQIDYTLTEIMRWSTVYDNDTVLKGATVRERVLSSVKSMSDQSWEEEGDYSSWAHQLPAAKQLHRRRVWIFRGQISSVTGHEVTIGFVVLVPHKKLTLFSLRSSMSETRGTSSTVALVVTAVMSALSSPSTL